MPRISRVVDLNTKIDYGFVWHIGSYSEMFDWWDSIGVPAFREAFTDAMHSRECGGANGHARNGWYLATLAAITGNLLKAAGKINTERLNGMMNAIALYGTIFINRNGGYFYACSTMRVSDTHHTDEWILPGTEVRFLQWPNGQHWYAKIGDLDVEWCGRGKWDTKEEAAYAAERFLHTMRQKARI